MALTTIALLPHSPLLIPEIGQKNYSFLTKTIEAYQKIALELHNKQVNTLIIISPHGPQNNNKFLINFAPEMKINLKDFGFINPETIFSGDALLADKIQNLLRPEFPVELSSENIIDNGSAIPLYLLKETLLETKIIIIHPAQNLSLKEQFKFGEKLQSIFLTSDKNIALIASGDLSHRLQKKSPGGYSPRGAKFDNKLIEYLSQAQNASENIIKMDSNLIAEAGECGLKPLVLMLGTLSGLNWESQVLAYQTDFGIGYLSMNFSLNKNTKI